MTVHHSIMLLQVVPPTGGIQLTHCDTHRPPSCCSNLCTSCRCIFYDYRRLGSHRHSQRQFSDEQRVSLLLYSPPLLKTSYYSFWANKGAVAATFVIISIVGLVVIFSATTFALRRRKRRLAEGDLLTEKYLESVAHDDMSTHSVILPAAGDAYPDRQIHYGTDMDKYGTDMDKLYPVAASNAYPQPTTQRDQQYSYSTQNYSVGYPPGTAYAQSPDIPAQYETQASYYYQGASRSTQSPTPPQLPAIPRQDTSLAPVAYRGGRRESWQQSIDSFYGAPGPSGAR
jgi:hypothetical protein